MSMNRPSESALPGDEDAGRCGWSCALSTTQNDTSDDIMWVFVWDSFHGPRNKYQQINMLVCFYGGLPLRQQLPDLSHGIQAS